MLFRASGVYLRLAVVLLIFSVGVSYGQGGDPILSKSHFIGPMSQGVGAFLTDCPDEFPILLPGQICTDTFATVFENNDGSNSQPPMIYFYQIRFGENYFSGESGIGPATLSIKAPLRSAEATANIDSTFCERDVSTGEFVCSPRLASISVFVLATSEITQNKVAIYNEGHTLSLRTGLGQLRTASSNIILNGHSVPGDNVDWAQSFLTRSRSVDVCISVYEGNCF